MTTNEYYLTGILVGSTLTYSIMRWWIYRKYFGIEDRIVKRLEKEGVRVVSPKEFKNLVDTEGMTKQ